MLLFQILLKRTCRILIVVSMSALIASTGISSDPAALPFLWVLMTFCISVIDGSSQFMVEPFLQMVCFVVYLELTYSVVAQNVLPIFSDVPQLL